MLKAVQNEQRESGAVTGLLQKWGHGDRHALNELVPLVQDELRRIAGRAMARESSGHILQATALVNEAYIRLIGQHSVTWQSRAHFFGVAAQAMRRILVDDARMRKAGKREALTVALDENLHAADERPLDLVALDDALQELEQLHPRQTRVIGLRYFGGLEINEVAEVLGVSASTVKLDWQMARAWLKIRLQGGSRASDEVKG